MGLIADEQPAIATLLDAAGQTHSKGMQSYLTMMAVRLLELRRVLKDTGSLYLHCDPVASHYLKQLLDAVFGRRNFRNEIVWSYRRWSVRSKKLPSTHDCLILYGRTKNVTWTPIEIPNVKPNPSQYVSTKDASGKTVVKRDAQGHAMKRKIRETIPVAMSGICRPFRPMARSASAIPRRNPLRSLNGSSKPHRTKGISSWTRSRDARRRASPLSASVGSGSGLTSPRRPSNSYGRGSVGRPAISPIGPV